MIKQNLHTHTLYCDGRNTVDEMIQEAIRKKFTILGFSGHGPNRPLDSCSMSKQSYLQYLHDVQKAKDKYCDQIQIYCGVEQDLIGTHFQKGDPLDYILGSVHFVPTREGYLAVDASLELAKKILSLFEGDFLAYAKVYYEEVIKQAFLSEVDIIGHLDLLMKYNEDESFFSFQDPRYIHMACECIDALIDHQKILEVNTGAMARGLRSMPYPQKDLLAYIASKKGKICLNSDCHQKEKLDYGFELALEEIKRSGFSSMMVISSKGFEERAIEEFFV